MSRGNREYYMAVEDISGCSGIIGVNPLKEGLRVYRRR